MHEDLHKSANRSSQLSIDFDLGDLAGTRKVPVSTVGEAECSSSPALQYASLSLRSLPGDNVGFGLGEVR